MFYRLPAAHAIRIEAAGLDCCEEVRALVCPVKVDGRQSAYYWVSSRNARETSGG